jgi:hypothetical protein
MPLDDDITGALPSQTEPFVDRYRAITPAWWPWMKALWETVRAVAVTSGNNEIAIQEITEVTENLGVAWSVQVTVNNHVTGLIKLSGDEEETSFIVVADKFKVSHPLSPTTVVDIFTITGGDVQISGNLLVAGSITAEKLDVVDLSSITANVGTLTAGLIESTDGKSFWDLDTGEFVIGAP